ncbi:hypothetical protein MNBD_GAMMA12-965 [hydrothermal vent metagenome]|uniref:TETRATRICOPEPTIDE REPEAT FAMILY PROTEIN n=1 Tax=hydrothermal vent metagenome TaxID=652676 RepID=A0A3B0YLU8_9ZZZZ
MCGINMTTTKISLRVNFSFIFFLLLYSTTSTVYSYTIFDQRTKQLIAKASTGNMRAQYKLGCAYMIGISVKFDQQKAKLWLEKSAAQNYYKAWFRLGELHYKSRYGTRNYAISYKWFKKAAEKNHGLSQYYLAMQLYSGQGISKRIPSALKWANRAKKNGIGEATNLLRKISKKRLETEKIAKPALKTKVASARKNDKKLTRNIDVRKLLYVSKWKHKGIPSDYMPSINNNCVKANEKIRCTSKRIRDKQTEYTADFRIVSLITNFQPKGQFTIRYRKKYVLVLRGDSKEEDKIPGLGYDDKVSKLKCRVMKSKQIECAKSDKSLLRFSKR